jgi:hypothetical protein
MSKLSNSFGFLLQESGMNEQASRRMLLACFWFEVTGSDASKYPLGGVAGEQRDDQQQTDDSSLRVSTDLQKAEHIADSRK